MCVCMAVHVAYLATGRSWSSVLYSHAIVARARSVCPRSRMCPHVGLCVAGREIADVLLICSLFK